MSKISKVLAKLAFIAVVGISLTGCNNENTENKVINSTEFINNNQNIILKGITNETGYTGIVKELTQNTQMTEKELFEIFKTNYIEAKKDGMITSKEKLNMDFAIDLYSKKYNFKNKLINQDELNEIVKKVTKDSFENELDFDETNVNIINKTYGITTIKQLGYSVDVDFLNIPQIESDFALKYKTDNYSNFSDYNRDVFNISYLIKELKDNEGVKKHKIEQKNKLLEKIEVLEKQIKLEMETGDTSWFSGTIEEQKKEIEILKETIKVNDAYILVIDNMILQIDNDMKLTGGYSPSTGGSGYSSSHSSFVPIFVNQILNNHSNAIHSSSFSSRGGYGS